MKKRRVNLGLIGLGTVGGGIVQLLRMDRRLLEEKAGCALMLKHVVDKDPRRLKDLTPRGALAGRDSDAVLEDPGIDIVIEVIGGVGAAGRVIRKALLKGKHVVTANKALLSEQGVELFRLASARGVEIGFEASVGGGIPVLRALVEGLAADRIHAVFGIVNGTANYILTCMADRGEDFKTALAEAQDRGYAEQRNPGLDVDGVDSAHKLAILASLAFRQAVPVPKIFTEGIRRVTLHDLRYAEEFGYRVKLMAVAKRTKGGIEVRVQPTMIPKRSPLASVDGVYNAICFQGDAAGDTLLYGKGAGCLPSASAVLSDVISIARRMAGDSPGPVIGPFDGRSRIRDVGEFAAGFYLRLQVLDIPGVLSQISGILAENAISIASVIQKERRKGAGVPILMLLHEAPYASLRKAVDRIDSLDCVKPPSLIVPVEDAV